MPHVRQWKAAEVRCLDAVEHDRAIDSLRQLVEINTAIQSHVAQVDDMELTMGRILAETFDRDWARAVTGKTTSEWVSTNLRGRDGSPLGEDAARNLARDWRAISAFPLVEAFVRAGSIVGTRRVTCRTAAYFACETAIVSEWLNEAVLKEIEKGNIDGAKEAALDKVSARIIDLLKRKSATQLRDDFFAMKKEMREQGDAAKRVEWVSIKGSVPREVADAMDEALYRIVKFAGDDLDLDEASLTQKMERLSGWATDAMDAVEAVIAGNDGKLRSILEQAKERL